MGIFIGLLAGECRRRCSDGPAPVAGKHGLLDPNPPSFVCVAQILVLDGAPPNQEFANLREGLRTRPFPRFPLHGPRFENGSKALPFIRPDTESPSDEDKIVPPLMC